MSFFFFSRRKKSVFPLGRQLSGAKAQKSGRTERRSVTAMEPWNYLIYLIPRVCILGRIRINDCFFPPPIPTRGAYTIIDSE